MRNSAGPAGAFESEYRPDSAAPASNAFTEPPAHGGTRTGCGKHGAACAPFKVHSVPRGRSGPRTPRERGAGLEFAPSSSLSPRARRTGCRPRILQGLPPGCVSYLVTLMLRAFCVTLFSAAQRPVHCGVLNEVPGLPLVGSSSGLYMVAILIPSYLQPPLALTLPSTQ